MRRACGCRSLGRQKGGAAPDRASSKPTRVSWTTASERASLGAPTPIPTPRWTTPSAPALTSLPSSSHWSDCSPADPLYALHRAQLLELLEELAQPAPQPLARWAGEECALVVNEWIDKLRRELGVAETGQSNGCVTQSARPLVDR